MKKSLPDPISAIKFRMEQMGWSAAYLACATGYGKNRISDFLNKRRPLSLRFIRAYYKACEGATPAEVLIQEYKINPSP